MIKIIEINNNKIKRVNDKVIIDGIKYMPLTETTINRVVNGHDKEGYAIISACRESIYKNDNGDISLIEKDGYFKIDPNSQEHTDINNIHTKQLKEKIKNNNYSYVEVFGGFKEEGQKEASFEKSFIVFPFNYKNGQTENFNKFFDTILEWAVDYNQDAILFKFPNKNPRYFDKYGNYVDDTEFTGTSINDITQEYFTALKKWDDMSRKNNFKNGKSQRFSYTIELYIRNYPETISEHHIRKMSGELVRFESYP